MSVLLFTAGATFVEIVNEIQEAFKNSYAEGIANSVNNIEFHGNNDNANSYHLWITYTTNGSSTTKQSAYVYIPYATDTAYGLAKYDDHSIKKNSDGQLYVNGELTDTKYSFKCKNSSLHSSKDGKFILEIAILLRIKLSPHFINFGKYKLCKPKF